MINKLSLWVIGIGLIVSTSYLACSADTDTPNQYGSEFPGCYHGKLVCGSDGLCWCSAWANNGEDLNND